MRGDLGAETGLLAVTSAHVVLGPDHRASLDETDQQSYSDVSHRLEAAARELNSDWHLETNKYSGHFRTVGPPAFSYRQYHDSLNRELHWYETFLQDLALLKINTTSKNIRVGQYFNHLKTCEYPIDNNEIAPFYTKVLGIVRIQDPRNIATLKNPRAKILVAGMFGHIVKNPHHQHLFDTSIRISHRIFFATDGQ